MRVQGGCTSISRIFNFFKSKNVLMVLKLINGNFLKYFDHYLIKIIFKNRYWYDILRFRLGGFWFQVLKLKLVYVSNL